MWTRPLNKYEIYPCGEGKKNNVPPAICDDCHHKTPEFSVAWAGQAVRKVCAKCLEFLASKMKKN